MPTKHIDYTKSVIDRFDATDRMIERRADLRSEREDNLQKQHEAFNAIRAKRQNEK